jgi:hypothetical protein
MSINLRKANSKLNEQLAHLADNLVGRGVTIPYVKGHQTADHVNAIQKVLAPSGGLGRNVILTYHREEGRGFNSEDGETVAYSTHKMRNAIIPTGNKDAKAAIEACNALVSNCASAVGSKDPAIVKARGQLALVEKNAGIGMTVFNLVTLLINCSTISIQAVARAHSNLHPDGPHVKARVPHGKFDAGADEEPGNSPAASAPAIASPAPNSNQGVQ